jgi:Glycosyltransferase family 92
MRKFLMIFFLLSFPICRAEYRYNLAICAIFQDEAPYLKEWIEFHRLIGFEHFYLYNHRSQDNYREELSPYIESGLVELKNVNKIATDIEVFNPLQCKCYTECLIQARGACKWLAFIDIDEYLFPVERQSLLVVLQEYEKYGGVGVNWRVFGSSRVWKILPNQLLIEALTRCTVKNYRLNNYIKSIVRPERTSHYVHPHIPIFYGEYFAVNTDRLPVEGMKSTYVQTNKLQINHYWTRDGQYFYEKKIQRQKQWGGTPIPQEIIPKVNEEEDDLILRYVPALKEAMGFTS